MKSLFIVITFFINSLVWANSTAVKTEDYKPISLGEEAAAEKMIEQAMAEAHAVAQGDEKPSDVVATQDIAADTKSTVAINEVKSEAKVAAPLSQTDTKNLKESEIPVLTKTVGQKTENKSPWGRFFLSFVVIVVTGFGLYQATKWWQKKTAINSDNNRIKVVNQHYLGPRKSLAIIRVAGETILIGVTDSNISHIKTLSLLEDEEVPTEVPQNFATELTKNEGQEDESAWSQVRDRLSTKIKDMRPI